MQLETYSFAELVQYDCSTVIIKTILEKSSGSIIAIAVPAGKSITEKTIAFDTFIQIIDGTAEIVINEIVHSVTTGLCIIIPAHTKRSFRAIEKFKMISMVMKSGYENWI